MKGACSTSSPCGLHRRSSGCFRRRWLLARCRRQWLPQTPERLDGGGTRSVWIWDSGSIELGGGDGLFLEIGWPETSHKLCTCQIVIGAPGWLAGFHREMWRERVERDKSWMACKKLHVAGESSLGIVQGGAVIFCLAVVDADLWTKGRESPFRALSSKR